MKESILNALVDNHNEWLKTLNKRSKTVYGNFSSHFYLSLKLGEFLFNDHFISSRDTKLIEEMIADGDLILDERIKKHQGLTILAYKPAKLQYVNS